MAVLAQDEVRSGEPAAPQATTAVAGRSPDAARALLPAMAGLLLLAIAMVFFAWWGARVVRRRLRQPLGPTITDDNKWYHKPLPPETPRDEESQE